MHMIEFKNVSKTYKNGTHALENINLKVDDGEFVYIMGPTGSGKSTMIKLLDGEEVPSGGQVIVNNVNVGRLRKSRVYLYRRKIGVVFQDYRLLPEKTVFENVAYALEVLDYPNDKIRRRVRDVLKLVDLSEKSNSRPRELSGGQQQRVAIARAIAKRPAILIADEPTGNLDPSMTDEMITLLERINKEEKTTLLVVTHNDVMVEYHPKRTIRIQSGHIVDDGTHGQIFGQPSFYHDMEKKTETLQEAVLNKQRENVVSGLTADMQLLADINTPEEEYVHKPHVPSEGEAQDAAINEITMQLNAIRELSAGDEEK